MNAPHAAPRPGRSRNARTRLSRPGKPALADVQREFAGYHCWRAASGLFYARPCEARPGDPAPVKGDDPPGLREAIIQHQARREAARRDAVIEEILIVLFRPAPTPGPATGARRHLTSGSALAAVSRRAEPDAQ
jgi:hypothetical protein